MPHVVLKPFHKGIFHAGFPVIEVEMTELTDEAKLSVYSAICTENLQKGRELTKNCLHGHSFS